MPHATLASNHNDRIQYLQLFITYSHLKFTLVEMEAFLNFHDSRRAHSAGADAKINTPGFLAEPAEQRLGGTGRKRNFHPWQSVVFVFFSLRDNYFFSFGITPHGEFVTTTAAVITK